MPSLRAGEPARLSLRRLTTLPKNATTFQTTKETLDDNHNGKISKHEFLDLDENKDGRVSHHEASDVNNDGKVTHKEKQMLDSNDDGKVNRHEILKATNADLNADGKVTKSELHHVERMPPPPPSSQLHAAPAPVRALPRTSWPFLGMFNSFEEAVDETVLVLVCAVSLHQAVRWLHRRLTGAHKKKYKAVKVADAYGPDPGVELAEQSMDAVPEPPEPAGAAMTGGSPAGAVHAGERGAGFSQTAAEAESLFADDSKPQVI